MNSKKKSPRTGDRGAPYSENRAGAWLNSLGSHSDSALVKDFVIAYIWLTLRSAR